MKQLTDRQKYDIETFDGIYYLIYTLLNQLQLTDKRTEYQVNGVAFEIRKLGDIVEMGLPTHSPIFPTLAFRQNEDGTQAELLEYRINKDFKNALFQATEMYVRGKEKVNLIFKKELRSSDVNQICYETVMPSFMQIKEQSTVVLAIDDLQNMRLNQYWDKEQLRANNLFENKSAKLVLVYGDKKEFGKKTSLQLTADGVFISWRVDSIEFITSIANSLKSNSNLSLKIDLDEDDFAFEEEKTIYNADISKISLSFN